MRRHATAVTTGSNWRRVLPVAALAAVGAVLFALAGVASALSPLIVTGTASNVAKTSATLNGTVNPQGEALETCLFEYAPSSSFQSSSTNPTAPCAETVGEIGAGTTPVSVHANVSGLEPGTEYTLRLTAHHPSEVNQAGFVTSFITLGPVVSKEGAGNVNVTSATVSAFVYPNGQPTTYHFEYVDDAGFQAHGFTGAARLPVPDGSAGAGTVGKTVSAELSGLQASTLYHFRIVATNSDGTSDGPGSTFRTYAPASPFAPCGNEALRYGYGGNLPDCRAYEQASPINKNGTSAMAAWFTVQASSTDGGISFWTPAGMPGGKGAADLTNYAALRGTDGWSTVGLLPPAALGQFGSIPGWTPDLRYTISIATRIGEGTGLFIENNANSSVATMVPYQTGGEPHFYYVGASVDNSKVFFEDRGPALTPEAIAGEDNLYVWDRGTGAISLVGVLPASACVTAPCAPPGGSFAGGYDQWENKPTMGGSKDKFFTQAQHVISNDGSKVYFTSSGADQIYLRENPTSAAATTVKISASQKTNGSGPGGTDPNGPQPAAFLMATPDGSQAFFTSPEELTNNATTGPSDNGRDLYRYEAANGHLTDLTPDTTDPNGAEVMGMLGTSENGSRVYFVANGDLDGSGPAVAGNCHVRSGEWSGECSLYLWHEGQITFVARLEASKNVDARGGTSDATNWAPRGKQIGGNATILNSARVSADGNVVLFRSERKLTAYDNHGVPEFYRYDASSGKLDCVSCNPSGIAPVGRPELQAQTSFLSLAAPAAIMTRNLSSSGDQVFFQTPDALLPADTNGVTDVYEWEADGAGSCQSSAENGGCLYLISTGKSPSPSNFADASTSGDEAFFFTEQQLVGQDEDELVDVYDARVNGGLASQNPQRPPVCSGEACRGAGTQAPGAKGAGTAVFSGPDNSAGQVGCVADPTIKRLGKAAKSLRSQARALSRRATHTSNPRQARKLRAKANRLGKSARAHETRAQKLVKRCGGVGRKGTR